MEIYFYLNVLDQILFLDLDWGDAIWGLIRRFFPFLKLLSQF